MRDRPDDILSLIEEGGYSFPSGHANTSIIFYLFLAFLVGRALKQRKHGDMLALIYALVIILIFLIGVSRVYLGVHYPSDIIAGWCLGGVLLTIFISLYDSVYPLKYHMGIQTSDWATDGISQWKRPTKS
jgi:undecaprenyl-diphosphatase